MDLPDTNQEAQMMRDIQWEHLDKPRFFFFGSSLFLLVRGLVFPSQVIKTRIAILKRGALYDSTLKAFSTIVKNEGFGALYRGFPVSAFGVVPSQALYISAYELSRKKAREVLSGIEMSSSTRNFISNGLGGAMASLSSQLIVIPIDVVAQRLMVQSKFIERRDGSPPYKNGFDVIRRILKTDGPKGFYRGFLPSILTHLPSSAVWWSSYGFAKSHFHALADSYHGPNYHSPQEDLAIQVASAVLSSCLSVTTTHPMDVIKIQMQAGNLDKNTRHTIPSVFKKLIKEEGLGGITKGWTARLMSSVPVSSLMLIVYELVKKSASKRGFRSNPESQGRRFAVSKEFC